MPTTPSSVAALTAIFVKREEVIGFTAPETDHNVISLMGPESTRSTRQTQALFVDFFRSWLLRISTRPPGGLGLPIQTLGPVWRVGLHFRPPFDARVEGVV